jgi:hypothetical protein
LAPTHFDLYASLERSFQGNAREDRMRGNKLIGAAAVALIAGLAGAANAQSADVPGDASTTATLSEGRPVNGAFDTEGDTDWYRLRVESGHRYVLGLSSVAESDEQAVDPMISIYDAEGNQVAFNDDSEGSLNSLLQYVPAQSGEVFVETREFIGRTGAYQLTVTATALPADDAGNDASTRARATVGRDIAGSIEYQGDVDWYRLSVRTGQRYRISLTGAGETGLGDPYLRIVTAEGEELGGNDDAGDGTLNSLAEFTPQRSGTVYIEARGFADVYEGAYTLRIEAERAPTDAISGASNTRGRVAVGGSVDGVIDFVGDLDWYRVRFEGGQSYRIRLNRAEGDGALGDPFLHVYGADGSELVADDDGGGSLNSYIEFNAPATGTYYIGAGAFSEGMGRYRLSVQEGDIPADASTDVELSAEGDYRDGVLAPGGDRDWYRVNLAEGQSFRASLVGSPALGAALDDPYIAIHGPNGEELAADDDGGEGLNSWLEFQAGAAGPYYLEVRGFSEGAQGSYSLAIAGGEIGATPDTAEYVQANGEGRMSVLSAADDVDWFAVDLVEARPYRFYLESADPDALADPVLTIYDEEGKPVAMDDDGGAGANAYLAFASPRGGRYFAAVSGYEGATGRYYLRVADTEVPGNVNTDEYMDSNGDDRLSNIEMPGERDFFRVDLEGGVRYTIEVTASGSSPLGNPQVSLVDANGEEVAADDDSGPGRNARLRFTSEQGGPYAISVGGANGAVGGYTVRISR